MTTYIHNSGHGDLHIYFRTREPTYINKDMETYIYISGQENLHTYFKTWRPT